LAGGLTSANLLHGSANAIGGQNAVIKLRWGSIAKDMIIKDAIEGIKFALGENVKQSNWGDDYDYRYPQTRMGVDQIIRDGFNAALDYQNQWIKYEKSNKKSTIKPRKDLELEALLEIIKGERIIHCHSYRQDEILNLIRIADDYGFTIGTFQHVLEGYKVADAIRDHGAGASTFTDWWAYKFEVYDAIPYNGVMMHKQGVLTSFNSDSNELARRMNLEAAKAIKYGDLSPTEALNFVTINPARQLQIDHRTGSIEKNKDADFVVWDSDPLSTYSKCEQTWIEGKQYFDIKEDLILRNRDKELYNLLVQKALKSDESIDKKGNRKHKPHYLKHSCGTQPYEDEF
jgi:N-acetylglucosamine-6-phosphate deacetylase